MVLQDLLRIGAKSSSSEEAVSESSDSTLASGSCEPVFSLLSVSSELLGLVLLGGLSLHLNHLIAERVSAPYRQFGTLPIGIFFVKFGLRTA